MGPVTLARAPRFLALALVVLATAVLSPARVLAGGGFSGLTADATFGVDMTFSATWTGSTPDRVEILLGFGTDDRLVVPVPFTGSDLTYRRDLTSEYVTPNTTVTYQWRAITGTSVTVSADQTLLYDDDRPGLDWQQARVGSATVHWYADNETIARRFGELAGEAADRAGDLLGSPLADTVDIFVYDDRETFFGAIGTANREWTGAATVPYLRTIFMWLGAGPTSYLEVTIAHETTHVVFFDATNNPFHSPASWFNEGTARWSEFQNADTEWDLVRREASSSDGLMAFEALVAEFPIDPNRASLAYAQGATMVDYLIENFAPDTMALIAAGFRNGGTEDEAIREGTGTSFDTIRADYFSSLGVTEPAPIEPLPLGRSDVPIPAQAGASPAPSASPGQGAGGAQDLAWWLIIGVVLIGVVFVGAVVVRNRQQPPAPPPPTGD